MHLISWGLYAMRSSLWGQLLTCDKTDCWNKTKIICARTDRERAVHYLWLLWFQDLACDWLQHNKHSRNISGVHAFVNTAVVITSPEIHTVSLRCIDETNGLDLFSGLGKGQFNPKKLLVSIIIILFLYLRNKTCSLCLFIAWWKLRWTFGRIQEQIDQWKLEIKSIWEFSQTLSRFSPLRLWRHKEQKMMFYFFYKLNYYFPT